jgi:hypothetical protein
VWLTNKSVVGAAHGNQSLDPFDENVLLLSTMGSSSRWLWSSWRRSTSRRRRSRSCRRWSRGRRRRRRNGWSPYKMWLIRSMLAIIAKLHVCLEVDYALNV